MPPINTNVPNSYQQVPGTPDAYSSTTPTTSRRNMRVPPWRAVLSLKPYQSLLLVLAAGLIALPILEFSSGSTNGIVSSSASKVLNNLGIGYTTYDSPTSGLITIQTAGGHASLPLTLPARLANLLARPALEQWEQEVLNRHACPFYTFSRNTYFFHDGKPEQWEKLGRDEVRKYRSKMVDALRDIEREGTPLVWEPEMLGEGGVVKRGLIFTGGGGKTLTRLKLNLHMLRNVLGCTLPIELYHFPDELEDPAVRQQLENDFAVDLKELGGKRSDGKNWHIKNAAFVQSEFTEFIYMDSDNIPLRDPAELFEGLEYTHSGSVFWPDLYKDHPDNAIFRVLGKTCSDTHWPAEAGQVVFDKRANNGLNLAVLHLANHMMQNPDMYGFLSYGDKDTFRFAFYALDLPYQQAPKIFATAGGYQTQNGEDSNEFCGHSMVQWGLTPPSERNNVDYHPPAAFLHTILAKHRYNLQAPKLFSHIRRPRLDGIMEPTLVRTLYEFTGDCFALTLKGPDGLPGSENSMLDGQGVIMTEMPEVLGGKGPVWEELTTLAETFVKINVPGDR